ncbi:MAG TPA: hypothetical protein VMU28_07740 [Terriglobales bacterium]|nr:hypothetical protein [Terriglobales bacterium]
MPKNLATGSAAKSDAAVVSTPEVHPQTPKKKNQTRVHWKPAIGQALLSTGIMHSFNLGTEAGTRDTLNGHWFQNYTHSLSELRGWSDSDTFMAPYVGHTIQGSSYGFILRQNDPQYRTVELGDGRDYYISLIRSMAFSAVWHAQWKIGPASEASIGNVMLHASPGFITLVATPTVGTVAMFGEDAADRYVIIGLENRTTNRPIIILARCFLNPGRSFANMMAFKVPWSRDTRIGLDHEAFLQRKQMMENYKAGITGRPFEFVKRPNDDEGREYAKAASIELAAFPDFEHFFGGHNCIGGGGSGAARVNASWQVIAEVNGCLMMGMPNYEESGDSLFYGGGMRWTPMSSRRVSAHTDFLFGGRKVTYEVDNLSLKKSLLQQWNDGNGTLPHYPKRSDWSVEVASNGPSLEAGGGMDVVVTRAFTWRLADLQYTHSWMADAGPLHTQGGIRFTTEAVLRIGTW